MRNLGPPLLAAIRAPVVSTRDYVWIVARNRISGAAAPIGLWSGAEATQVVVSDPIDGNVTRTFNGAAIQGVRDIGLSSALVVNDVTVELSAIDPAAEQVIRALECKGASVRIYRGFFNPTTRQMIGNAECRFVGFVDRAPIKTGSEGEISTISLECVSHTEELLRTVGFVRSLADQQSRRSVADTMHRDIEAMAEREVFWGRESGKPASR